MNASCLQRPIVSEQFFSPSKTLLCRSFDDVDQLASYVPEGIDLKMTQLSLQPFRCDSLILNLDKIRFSFNRLNCSIKLIGDKTPGFLCFMCLPHGLERPVISHNLPLTKDFLYGFDLNRGVNQVFPANSTHCAVSIRKDVFEACAEALDRPDLNAAFFASNYLYMPNALPPLWAYLDELYKMMVGKSLLLQKADFQRLILRDFLPLLVAALPIQKDHLKTHVNALHRSHLVKQAEDYMQSHLDQPLTLSDICNALHTSSRALSYGFQEIFGMSPMTYLKTMRLQGVHRALQAIEPDSQTITSIASQFGFWSLGHFSRDYKQMFGKLPSETIKR